MPSLMHVGHCRFACELQPVVSQVRFAIDLDMARAVDASVFDKSLGLRRSTRAISRGAVTGRGHLNEYSTRAHTFTDRPEHGFVLIAAATAKHDTSYQLPAVDQLLRAAIINYYTAITARY